MGSGVFDAVWPTATEVHALDATLNLVYALEESNGAVAILVMEPWITYVAAPAVRQPAEG
jgi:hypothetical protein